MERSMHRNHYRRLLIMALLSFATMYVLMYAMVDRWENVFAIVGSGREGSGDAPPLLSLDERSVQGFTDPRRTPS